MYIGGVVEGDSLYSTLSTPLVFLTLLYIHYINIFVYLYTLTSIIIFTLSLFILSIDETLLSSYLYQLSYLKDWFMVSRN